MLDYSRKSDEANSGDPVWKGARVLFPHVLMAAATATWPILNKPKAGQVDIPNSKQNSKGCDTVLSCEAGFDEIIPRDSEQQPILQSPPAGVNRTMTARIVEKVRTQSSMRETLGSRGFQFAEVLFEPPCCSLGSHR